MKNMVIQARDGVLYKSNNVYQVVTHRVKTDYENGRHDRDYLPMVFVFDDNNTWVTREWQYFLVAINYLMTKGAISRMLDDNVAFCNGSGVAGKSKRRDWIKMENLDNKDPEFDKTRTAGDAKIHLSSSGQVKMMDGRYPPPLRAGYNHPTSVDEAYVSWKRYAYNPILYPEYFFAATTTGSDGKSHSWPNSAAYPWYKNGAENVAWMFHVSDAPVSFPPQQPTDNTPILEVI